MTEQKNRNFLMCGRKRQFVTEDEAKNRAQSIKDTSGTEMRPYHCPVCKGWHLARKSKQAPYTKPKRKKRRGGRTSKQARRYGGMTH